MRVAEGGVLRLFGRIDDRSDVEVRGTIDDEPFSEILTVGMLDGGSPVASAVRRGVFREVLASWMDRYRHEPGEALKNRIVEVSLREGIPTALTALQVDDPRLAAVARTATATASGTLILLGSLALGLSALLGFPAVLRRSAG